MSQKSDLRVVKTRKAILDAFTHLYNAKGYDKLTVQDIATAAQINRNTFYLHYKDKDDLFHSLIREHLGKLTKRMGDLSDLNRFNRDVYVDTVQILLATVREDLAFYQALLWKNPSAHFIHELKLVLRNSIPSVGEDDLLLYVSEYMLSGLVGVLARWIQDPEEPFPMLDPVMLDIQYQMVSHLLYR